VSRFPGGVLCVVVSVMLMLCALRLSARESVWAGAFVAVVALGLLFAAITSLRTGAHKT
jgi:multisubunit Na+/H+ antiporter MnhB subunit